MRVRSDQRGGTAALAWALVGLATALCAAGLALSAAARIRSDALPDNYGDSLFWMLPMVVMIAVGAVLSLRRPENPIGWIFLGTVLLAGYGTFGYGYAEYGLLADPGSLPGVTLVAWPGGALFLTFVLPAVFVPLLFPDGRPPGPRWRLVGWAGGIGGALAATGFLLADDLFEGDPNLPSVENPIGVRVNNGVTDTLETVGASLSLLAVVGATASLVMRYRRAAVEQRRQIKWLAFVVVLMVAAALLGNLLTGGRIRDNALLDGLVSLLFSAGIPIAVAIAILRHRLLDIDLLLRRSFVYGVLWSAITFGYIAVAWLLGVAASGRLPVSAAILVTVAVTVVFQPARVRLGALADRLAFGRRRTDVEIVADVGATLEPRSVAGSLRQGLRLRWARVVIPPAPAGVDGRDDGAPPTAAIPIDHAGQTFGVVEVGDRIDGPLRESDQVLLRTLARQVAVALHAARLVEELTSSRARLVQAEEAERRRIQRNLHDGAQQDLVALLAKARLARDRLTGDPDGATAVVAELQRDALAALRAVRELAQGIHPHVLTDRGLADAIDERAGRLPLDVVVEVDPAVRDRRFSDEVEGAAFFAAAEGMTNIVKHANASQARITIAQMDGDLTVEVADNGRGFVVNGSAQRGLPQLSDRIEALGGTLRVDSRPGSGTVLRARLPIATDT